EGSWPDLRLRGSVLGVEKLVDLLSGVEGHTVSATAPLLAEERRLFYVAVSRARETVLVSAVSGEDEQPSRFLTELDGTVEGGADEAATGAGDGGTPERAMRSSELVGELRRVTCAAEVEPERRRLAARQLARLAEERVLGEHTDPLSALSDVT